MKPLFRWSIPLFAFCLPFAASALELKVGEPAPLFTATTHEGKAFDLASRKGKWTVLFFYPKAGTPGCTRQAMAYRDRAAELRAAGAEVVGISADSVLDQASFHAQQKLGFPLIADPEGRVLERYGTKMALGSFSRRWTYILDPELKIRAIDRDVDADRDAQSSLERIRALKSAPAQGK